MRNQDHDQCTCSAAPKLIFACSGAADVGAIADQAARAMTRAGVGRMYCLAGIGGRRNVIMQNTAAAGAILAIDGCPTACARHTLEAAGFTEFAHVCLYDLGLTKGKAAVTAEHIEQVVAAGTARLTEAASAASSSEQEP